MFQIVEGFRLRMSSWLSVLKTVEQGWCLFDCVWTGVQRIAFHNCSSCRACSCFAPVPKEGLLGLLGPWLQISWSGQNRPYGYLAMTTAHRPTWCGYLELAHRESLRQVVPQKDSAQTSRHVFSRWLNESHRLDPLKMWLRNAAIASNSNPGSFGSKSCKLCQNRVICMIINQLQRFRYVL